MNGLAALAQAAGMAQLDIFGAFHPGPDDLAPKGCGTLVLLGPLEPGFWPHMRQSAEWCDGAPDPVDRWSARTISALAADFNATALFPFGPPPAQPFFRWALASGRAWSSPINLLVHDRAGLMVSYRGALALPERLDLPAPPMRPCDSCAEKPCLNACPVSALGAQGYDVPRCHTYLDTDAGKSCMDGGCLVRRACPISASYGRLREQSAYHMSQFH